MAEDYTRGEMDISHHKATFGAVMKVSIFCTLVLSVIILYLTLVFGTDTGWFSGLIVSFITAAAGGYFLKQGALYWVTIGLLAVITVISGVLTGLLSG